MNAVRNSVETVVTTVSVTQLRQKGAEMRRTTEERRHGKKLRRDACNVGHSMGKAFMSGEGI